MYRNDPTTRPDRVLLIAFGIFLATASATFGSAISYRPEAVAEVRPVITAANASPERDNSVQTELAHEHRCLTQALYYEARGEGEIGEKAVAEVVFHRLSGGYHGHSICAVVYEGSGRPGCQFSFTCDGSMKRPREATAWKNSEELAAQILTRVVALRNYTAGATNYHAISVKPDWAATMQKTTQIRHHVFYREGHMAES
jgi:spore germination cell wall hydrolase CwlJ-like protein